MESPSHFMRPDTLLFEDGGNLVVARLDVVQHRLVGEPVIVAPRISTQGGGMSSYSVSASGALLVMARLGNLQTTDRREVSTVWWNRAGTQVDSVDGTARGTWTQALSHDGNTLAFGGLEFWSYDRRRRVMTPFERETGEKPTPRVSPAWSPDDRSLIVQRSYSTVGDPGFLLYDIARGSTTPVPGLERAMGKPKDWSADGKYLLYEKSPFDTAAGQASLWVYSFATKTAALFAESSVDFAAASFSADSRYIAYDVSEGGRKEVYIRAADRSSAPVRVSTSGGIAPAWLGATQLAYVAAGVIMVADITPGSPPAVVGTRRLFTIPSAGRIVRLMPTRDGTQIGAWRDTRDDPVLTYVSNWPEFARRRISMPR